MAAARAHFPLQLKFSIAFPYLRRRCLSCVLLTWAQLSDTLFFKILSFREGFSTLQICWSTVVICCLASNWGKISSFQSGSHSTMYHVWVCTFNRQTNLGNLCRLAKCGNTRIKYPARWNLLQARSAGKLVAEDLCVIGQYVVTSLWFYCSTNACKVGSMKTIGTPLQR